MKPECKDLKHVLDYLDGRVSPIIINTNELDKF